MCEKNQIKLKLEQNKRTCSVAIVISTKTMKSVCLYMYLSKLYTMIEDLKQWNLAFSAGIYFVCVICLKTIVLYIFI